MTMRKVVISAKTGKLWSITMKYMRLCKMKNLDDLNNYNAIVFKITSLFSELESRIMLENIQIDFIDYEKQLIKIVSCTREQ